MKKLLITGFDPFGGASVNPSWEAVKRLPDVIGAYGLTRLQLPTVYGGAAELLLSVARELQADVILSIGQAGGRRGITPEVVGINLREAAIPDNAGRLIAAEPVLPGGPAAYFATVPVRAMVAAIRQEGLSASLSYSAGAFVCNDVLYTALHHYAATGTQVGFIHVPFMPEQAGAGVPSMALEDILRGLTAAIGALEQ